LKIKYLSIILLFIPLFSAKVTNNVWKKGLTFEQYLKEHKIPRSIIKLLDGEDTQLISEIGENRRFYEMVSSNGVLLQSLIPIGEELQLHLFRTPKGYKVEIIPIIYKKGTFVAILTIKNGLYQDIIKGVKSRKLANEFRKISRYDSHFGSLKRGDRLAVLYEQKVRLGKPIGNPDIKVAMIETYGDKYRYYIFKYFNGKYYNENGEELIQNYMGKPLKYMSVTSPFTYRRFHPILKRYKAHLGTDLRGRRGTPIYSVAKGVVIFSGKLGGYGKVIKIKHPDGYVSLYAHQSRLKAKVGERVKKGQIIGFVGSTGRSTGPHLHFGLYKDGVAINPMSRVKFSPKEIGREDRRIFFRRKRRYIEIINEIFIENRPSYVWNTVKESSVSPKSKKYYKKLGW
jgi:murein DD-endopeptidase MepM/ murein hydrolase activator NlpD